MNKTFFKRISEMLDFIRAKIGTEKVINVLRVACYAVLFLLLSSVPIFSMNSYHNIPVFLGIFFFVLSSICCFLQKKIFIDTPIIFFIVYLFVIAVSTIINGLTIDKTPFSMFLFFFSIYIFGNSEKGIKKLIYVYFLSLLFYSLYFIFLYSDSIISLDFDRLGSYFGNENIAGTYFSMMVYFSAYGLFYNKKIITKIIFALLIFVALFLGFMTGSKAFLISFAGSIFIFFIIYFGKKRWYISLSTIIVAIIAIFVAINLPIFSEYKQRFIDFFSYLGIISSSSVDYSSIERLLMQKEAFLIFLQHPLLGAGYGGFAIYGDFGVYCHNTFLELLCNFGIIGFFFFEGIILSMIKKINFRVDKKYLSLAFAIIFQILILHMTGVMFTSKAFFLIVSFFAVLCKKIQGQNASAECHREYINL